MRCVRYFPNRGFRLWGARTASSDPEFKYVNVRRYLVYLEHSIDRGTQYVVTTACLTRAITLPLPRRW